MDLFITVFFWIQLIVVIARAAWLAGEHPRKITVSVGGDALGMVVATTILAWVSVLKFGQ